MRQALYRIEDTLDDAAAASVSPVVRALLKGLSSVAGRIGDIARGR